MTVSSVTVGGDAKVADKDYTIDHDRGLFGVVEGGGIADDASVTVTFATATATRTLTISGNRPMEGALRFQAFNLAGKQVDYYLPRVRITPNGDFAIKGDAYQKLPFNVKILKLPNRAAIYADGLPYSA